MKRNNPASFDDRDRAIMAALANDAWLTYVELAARVNLSASAVQRRVERLVAVGAIEGARARIAGFATNRPITIHVLIELHGESHSVLEALSQALQTTPAIDAAHYVTGSFDIILTMRCSTMQEYADFAETHFNRNPQVRRYQTLTVMRSLL